MLEIVYSGYLLLLRLCGALTGLVIGLIAILVSLNIALRQLAGITFPWLIDLVEVGLFVATFLAAPWVLRLGGHVRVDLLVRAVGPLASRWINIVAELCGLAVSILVTVYGFTATLEAYAVGSLVIKTVVYPEWWPLSVLPISGVLLSVEFSLRLYRAIAFGDTAAPEEGA